MFQVDNWGFLYLIWPIKTIIKCGRPMREVLKHDSDSVWCDNFCSTKRPRFLKLILFFIILIPRKQSRVYICLKCVEFPYPAHSRIRETVFVFQASDSTLSFWPDLREWQNSKWGVFCKMQLVIFLSSLS